MKKISAVLISFNEEDKIEKALHSLRPVADEIVVVDSLSTDNTPTICREMADCFVQRQWPGYRDQKQFATDLARYDWVLSLDCDEVVSPELRDEILRWKRSEADDHVGYRVPRLTRFMGRWIRHTIWYPDRQLRLFRRDRGRWGGGRVHESFRVDGPQGRLTNHILHHTYSGFSEYLTKLDRFSSLAAADAVEKGVKRVGFRRLALDPVLVFFKSYVIKLGFLDGKPGLAVSALAAFSTLSRSLKLWELLHRDGEGG